MTREEIEAEAIRYAKRMCEHEIDSLRYATLSEGQKIANDFIAGAEWALPKWIKCSERLPKKGEWVLRYSPTRGPETDCIKFILPDGIPAWWGDYVYNCEDATHWMPLPSEPPSEKEGESEIIRVKGSSGGRGS